MTRNDIELTAHTIIIVDEKRAVQICTAGVFCDVSTLKLMMKIDIPACQYQDLYL